MQDTQTARAAIDYLISRKGLTGRALGRRIGYSEAQISRIKNGRANIPEDVLERLLRETGDPRFLIDHLTARRLLPVNMPRPKDLNESLLAATVRVAREMGEAVDHCRALVPDLADVREDEQLTPEQLDRIVAAGVEIIEAIMFGLCWYASVNDRAPGVLDRMEAAVRGRRQKKAG